MSQLEPLYGTLGVTHRDEQVAAASRLSTVFDGADLFARLDAIATATTGPAVFTTSFGLEDQAIAHAILSRGLPIDIVTLDTGRLFPETYDVWAKTEARYATRIRAAYPRHDALEALVSDQGIDGFYRSLQARKACCNVRKVEPLARALSGAAVWVTGLRGDQSDQRKGVSAVEVDDDRGLIKANPLFDWSRDEVLEFTAAHDVPVSALHAKGFLSIGCAPCTRAVASGEPERAGRWWWEDEAAKECGLHVGADGRLVRTRVEATR
jgi:phosphoadenosine phosphosulfate reductase